MEATLGQYGQVRGLVWGQYGEASLAVHELFDLAVQSAARRSWRDIGARSEAEARGYFSSTMRRRWGVIAVRAMARHRLRRVHFVGAPRGQRGVQAAGAAREEWDLSSRAEFHAYAGRMGRGAFGQSARRGAPRR